MAMAKWDYIYVSNGEGIDADDVIIREMFDEMLNDAPMIEVYGGEFYQADVLKQTDPIAYRTALLDFADSLAQDGDVIVYADDSNWVSGEEAAELFGVSELNFNDFIRVDEELDTDVAHVYDDGDVSPTTYEDVVGVMAEAEEEAIELDNIDPTGLYIIFPAKKLAYAY